jgi:hypothetical protein
MIINQKPKFDTLTPADLRALFGALEYNTHFTRLVAKQFAFQRDTVQWLAGVLAHNASIEVCCCGCCCCCCCCCCCGCCCCCCCCCCCLFACLMCGCVMFSLSLSLSRSISPPIGHHNTVRPHRQRRRAAVRALVAQSALGSAAARRVGECH